MSFDFRSLIPQHWTAGQLAKHFLKALFDGKVAGVNMENRSWIASLLGVLAVPGVFVTFFLLDKYSMIDFRPDSYREAASIIDKCFFLSFSMAAIGIAAVTQIEFLIPDRHDFIILVPLGLKLRTIFTAKMLAVTCFLGIIFVDVNVLTSIVFPPMFAPKHIGLGRLVAIIGAHAVSVLAASIFVILFFVALQGLLVNIFRARYVRFLPFVQFASVLLLTCMLLLFLVAYSQVAHENSRMFPYLPPLWFLGIYEVLLGHQEPMWVSLAHMGLAALVIVTIVAFIFYGLSYARLSFTGLEAQAEVNGDGNYSRRRHRALWDKVLRLSPTESGIFHFVMSVLSRSKLHRLVLAASAGVGCGFLMLNLILTVSRSAPDMRSVLVLALFLGPTVMQFFLLSGMRIAITLPAELEANWLFQTIEGSSPRRYMNGIRKAIFVLTVVPTAAISIIATVLLWGVLAALWHIIFFGLVSFLAIEIFVYGLQKIPFTCASSSTTPRLMVLLVFYIVGAFGYWYLASLEPVLLQQPGGMVAFDVLLLGLSGWFFFKNRRAELEGFAFRFQEEIEPAVSGLQIENV